MTRNMTLDRRVATLSERFELVIKDMLQAFRQWKLRQDVFNRTYDELSKMTDRDLQDISISRCDISRIAREAANEAAEGR